jgi:hypothetical protein
MAAANRNFVDLFVHLRDLGCLQIQDSLLACGCTAGALSQTPKGVKK